jgi:hypothetical protein
MNRELIATIATVPVATALLGLATRVGVTRADTPECNR